MIEVDAKHEANQPKGKVEKETRKKGDKIPEEEDIPETRIRTLSAVTVSIWLK
jgi:hypothetical protein